MRRFGWLRRGCLPGLIFAAVVIVIGIAIPSMNVSWPTQRLLAPIIAVGLCVILYMWTSGVPRESDGFSEGEQQPPRGWTEQDQRRHERLKRKDAPRVIEDDEDSVRPDDFRR